MLQIGTSAGNIFYSEELIKDIVSMSAMECNGVVEMANRSTNGVKIGLSDEKLDINVFVIVKYGIKISTIANDVIQKIKSNVENYAGVSINSITVNIKGVKFEK